MVITERPNEPTVRSMTGPEPLYLCQECTDATSSTVYTFDRKTHRHHHQEPEE